VATRDDEEIRYRYGKKNKNQIKGHRFRIVNAKMDTVPEISSVYQPRNPQRSAYDDRKLLFEIAEALTQETGRCQTFVLFLIRD